MDNNAYTNVMAVWVLCRALEIIEQLPADHRRELLEKLDLQESEIARWEDVSRKMRVVFHDGGIISQFEGYEHLMEFDWAAYREKYGDIQRLDRILEAEEDTTNRYKLSKQADVLMLFYVLSAGELRELFQRLGYDLDADQIRKNIHYYLQRTSHGSTLSRVVHSWVLARSDRPQSWQLFMEALESDVADIQGGTTPEGIHLGAMAGTIDLVQRGYSGLEMRGDVLWFNPSLPGDLRQLAVRIRYRQHSLRVEATCEQLTVRADDDSPGSLSIGFKEHVYELGPGETKTFDL
ncbi:MAG: glycosyl hydrolase family 65 protein [Dehalococcoidia bacterium]